jgi:putative membrane protein
LKNIRDERQEKIMINERMKAGVLYSAIGVLAAFGAACSNEPGKETANSAPIIKSEPAKPASDKGDAVVTGGDLDFMNTAAASGMAEVELGKMAASKAQNAEVKAFGQKMVEDHSKAGEELKQLAAQKKVMLPPDVLPTHKQLMEKLSKLSGAEFDKDYVAAMVADHDKRCRGF